MPRGRARSAAGKPPSVPTRKPHAPPSAASSRGQVPTPPGAPPVAAAIQVGHGPHSFTYDAVFGPPCGDDPDQLYPKCVAPLVAGLFRGYNATVRPAAWALPVAGLQRGRIDMPPDARAPKEVAVA